MILVSKLLNTIGDGYWSDVAKSVPVVALDISYVNDEGDFGELRVFFDTQAWDVSKDGLIYTDNLFLKELRDLLQGLKLAADDVEYSEQGMQGRNYVSLDIGADFIKSYNNFLA